MTASDHSHQQLLIDRQDVRNGVSACEDLLKTAGKYHRKLLEMSQIANEFAVALDGVSKCKGAEQSGIGLKAASELHRLIAKDQEQLAELVQKEFELPLQRNLTSHQKRVDENERIFEKTMRKMQDEISKTESKMLKGRKKDLSVFQQSLQDMQRQAQEMERLKMENLEKMLGDEQKNLMFLVQKVAGVVKSEYDHFNNMAALSREATEDIISIAFAPPGKATLDPVEKRRVVEKFLGTPQAPSPVPTGGSVNGIQESINAAAAAAAEFESRRGSAASHGSAAFAAAAAARPATPPGSPQPQSSVNNGPVSRKPSAAAQSLLAAAAAAAAASGTVAASASTSPANAASTIQESLKRLNLAASQIQRQPTTDSSSSDNSISAATTVGQEEPTASLTAAASASSPISGAQTAPAQHQQDLIIAIYDFNARSDRELSFKKNDILIVKQRQENWLYACHKNPPAGGSSGPVKSGWIPFSYTAEYHP